jgi:DNA-directed RNA polymerase specialized sigma24 family protein
MNSSGTSIPAPNAFPHTRWSVVLAARNGEASESAAALESLCQSYWYPLYAYARRQGRSPQDAQDLTQGFFALLLEKAYLNAVAREKGRFRSFLLVAFKRFLAKEWDRDHAQKRGCGRAAIVLDTEFAERRYLGEGTVGLPPDRLYEHRWALTLLERGLARLRGEYNGAGRAAEFELLKGWLAASRGEIPYAQVAAALGVSEGAARVAVHRLRKRFREIFRAEIAATVATGEEVDDEVRYLLGVLSGP